MYWLMGFYPPPPYSSLYVKTTGEKDPELQVINLTTSKISSNLALVVKGLHPPMDGKIHPQYGHVDINRLVFLKRKVIVHSSLIPSSTKIKYLVKDCPVCLAMNYRKPSTPTSKTVVYKEMYEVWEKVYTDNSGPFQVKSIKGNYYYAVFVDEKSGRYLTISYANNSEFPLVFLQFVAKTARFPIRLVCDSAGEMLSATTTGTFALHELSFHVVPKGEHFANGPAERAIALIDNMVKTLLAAPNLPCTT